MANPKFYVPESVKKKIAENFGGKVVLDFYVPILEETGKPPAGHTGLLQFTEGNVIPYEQALKKFGGKDVDEADLTDEQLSLRIQSLQQGARPQGSRQVQDAQKLAREIARYAKGRINANGIVGVKDDVLNAAALHSARQILSNTFKPIEFAEVINNLQGADGRTFEALGSIASRFGEQFNKRAESGEFTNTELIAGQDFSEDIKRIEDLMASRKEKQEAEKAVEDFLFSSQAEADSAREQFINKQVDIGSEFLEDVAAPNIVEELNRRSPLLTRGGQVSGILQSEAIDVASKIQELALNLGEEDFKFYADSSYQNMIRKLAEETTTTRANLDFQRASESQRRENTFNSSQRDIERKFNLDLFQRQAERNLMNQKRQVDLANERRSDQDRSDTLSTVGQTALNIGTLVALKKFG